jgi:hypothetical protein
MLAVLEQGILARIKPGRAVAQNRRHPIGIASIDAPRKEQEGASLA